MNAAPRTVTVQTIDHGQITIPEPTWCVGHDDQPEQYRIDITHAGLETTYDTETSRGTATVLSTWFEQRPFIGDRFPGTGLFVDVELNAETFPSNPAQLHQLADGLETHAAALRRLADQLSGMLEAGEDQ